LPSRKPRVWWPTLQVKVIVSPALKAVEGVDGINVAGRRADQMENGRSKCRSVTDCLAFGA